MLKRLRGWWIRPTWEEFNEAKDEAEMHNQSYEDAEDDVEELQAENESLKETVRVNANANANLLLDLHESRQETKGLAEVVKKLGHDLSQEHTELQQERMDNERLRGILMDQVANTAIHSLEVKNNAIELSVRSWHWAIKAMAGSLLKSLDGAPNWSAISIGPIPSDEGMLIATVCRASGESPVETVGKLRVELSESKDNEFKIEALSFRLTALLKEWLDYSDDVSVGADDLICRSRAILNPDKKD